MVLVSDGSNVNYAGHTFAGWNSKRDGTGTDYATGFTYKVDNAIDLYAKWTSNGAGGSSSQSSGMVATVPVKPKKSPEEIKKEKIEKINQELEQKHPEHLVGGGKVYLDVKKSDWYYKAFEFALKNNLFEDSSADSGADSNDGSVDSAESGNGDSDSSDEANSEASREGNFSPKISSERGMVVKVLFKFSAEQKVDK